MKKTLTFLALVIIGAFSFSFLVKVGQAGTIGVGTYDTEGRPRDIFYIGADVRIMANSTHMPITINVTDPYGLVVYTETYYGYMYDKILSNLTEKLGWYKVEASSFILEGRENYARTYFGTFRTVGGKASPISKVTIKPTNNPELLAPYIGLTILLAVAVVTVVYVKKRKRNTEVNH